MSDRDKLESGKYTVISKLTNRLQIFLTLISVIGVFAVIVRAWDLTFDDQHQKSEIINLLSDKHPIDNVEVYKTVEHRTNSYLHMSLKEKTDIVIIKENQVKIGQDLAEIKTLIKSIK